MNMSAKVLPALPRYGGCNGYTFPAVLFFVRRERKVRIREGSPWARCAAWVLRADSVALTLGHTIHLHNARAEEFRADRRWVLHELKHVEQFRRYGFWLFLLLYAAESLRKGYHNNRFEVEARDAEHPFSSFDTERKLLS
jgi:hypothetical protein